MRRSATRLLHRLRSRMHGDERGMALIEVVVSAALVAMLTVGLLTSFDVAGATSGTNKARAVAASIAQDDQERMRGLEVRAIILRGAETRYVTAGKVRYRVESTAEIVTDSVNEGCTTGSGGIDYLKIHSEVSWPSMRIDPVVADSLMAPKPGSFGPGEGGLSVQAIDRDRQPIVGLNMSLAGPGSYSDTTDDNGCTFFPYITAGDYTVSFAQPGKVTPAGVANVAEVVGVPDGAVSNKILMYDTAARMTANFTTWTGATAGTEVADRGTSFAAGQSGIPAPGVLFFPSSPSGSQVAGITTSFTLFPFTSPYTAYSGTCVNARPELFGQTSRTVLLGPGASGSVNVLEPSLNVQVRYGGATAGVSGATLRYYNNTCPDVSSFTTAAGGRIPFPGMPYGVFDICADYDPDGTSGSIPRRRVQLNDYNNNDPDRENIVMNIPASNPANGSCPTS